MTALPAQGSTEPAPVNVLSIDVEEHFQVHAFERAIDRASWARQPSRVVANTERVLRLLRDHDVRATFFVLGWVADRHPGLVEAIAAEGHEVATHGYAHELVYRQTPSAFARDLEASLRAIAHALGGYRVAGYRAPAFSITKASLWALDVLRDHGIAYDSSIFPLVAHDRYGMRGAARFATWLSTGLWEIPVSTVRLGRVNVPVAGGGYFRLYPFWLTRSAILRLNREGQPAVVYLHPWEFDPDQPRVPNASRASRFRHYVNLGKTERRLRRLLSEFRFASMRDVYGERWDGRA